MPITYVNISSIGIPSANVTFTSANKYSYYEPVDTYSETQMSNLEQLKLYGIIPEFDVENLMVYAPLQDQIYGRTFIENGVEVNRKVSEPEYWQNRGFISVKDGKQVGFIPSFFTKNSLDISELKIATDRLTVPKHLPVFIAAREVMGKEKVFWKLVNVTAQSKPITLAEVEAGWTFIWRFDQEGEYEISGTVIDLWGNEHPLPERRFVKVMSKEDYIDYIENSLNSREITSNLAKNSLNVGSSVIDINFDDYEILANGTIINRNDGSEINLSNP
jgi:hypothetical protein